MLSPVAVVSLATVLACAAVAGTYATFTHTVDEPTHLAAGLALLDRRGDFWDRQDPPVARLAIALGPYLQGERSPRPSAGRQAPTADEGQRILYGSGRYQRVLTLARLGVLPFLVIVLFVTYAWARRLAGEWSAVAAVICLVATPPLLGSAGLASPHLPAAALALWSLYLFTRVLERQRVRTAIVFGAVMGGAFMTRFSALSFIAVSLVTVLMWRALIEPEFSHVASRTYLAAGVAAVATTLVVYWAACGFGLSFLRDIRASLLEAQPYHRLTAESYLLGDLGRRWWHYYLVGLAVRTPLPLLVMGVCGVGVAVGASIKERDWRIAVPALSFVAVLFCASAFTSVNFGVRDVLLLYPLLAIMAAFALRWLARAVDRRVAVAAAAVLIVGQASSSVAAHPDHLSYFNVVAGAHPERFLIAPDLDAGQDLKRLGQDLRRRGIQRVAVGYFGSADLSKHDLPGYSTLLHGRPEAGWVAVSRWTLRSTPFYSWLLKHEPVAHVGRSIDLYEIPESFVASLPKVPVHELAPGVFLRDVNDAHGCNQVFVIFDSFVVVFDPSAVFQARGLLAEIRARTTKPIRYVVNSHFHSDHSAGAAVFAAVGAEVVAAAPARKDFESWSRQDFVRKATARPDEFRGLTYAPPTQYLQEPMILDDGVQRLELIHYGHGHTSGDLIGWLPRHRIVLGGDLVSGNGRLTLIGAKIAQWITILERLRALGPQLVVPGHFSRGGPDLLEKSHQYLVELRSQVQGMVARGMTYEEVLRHIDIPFYERWSGIPVRLETDNVARAFAEAGGTAHWRWSFLADKSFGWLPVLGGLIATQILISRFKAVKRVERGRSARRSPR